MDQRYQCGHLLQVLDEFVEHQSRIFVPGRLDETIGYVRQEAIGYVRQEVAGLGLLGHF